MDKIILWFFTARADLTDTPFNPVPWLVICALGILVSGYYWVEGRRKLPFIKNNPIWKQFILDRMFSSPQVPVWAFVGLIVLAAQGLDTSFFSWRLWPDIWIAWGVGIVIFWIVYFVRDHQRNVVGFARFQERAKYLPGVGHSRRATSRR